MPSPLAGVGQLFQLDNLWPIHTAWREENRHSWRRRRWFE